MCEYMVTEAAKVGISAFHLAYPDKLGSSTYFNDVSRFLLRDLMPRFTPENFAEIWKILLEQPVGYVFDFVIVDAAGGAGGGAAAKAGGRRKKLKSRKSKTRKTKRRI
jgi:hypothetical protein